MCTDFAPDKSCYLHILEYNQKVLGLRSAPKFISSQSIDIRPLMIGGFPEIIHVVFVDASIITIIRHLLPVTGRGDLLKTLRHIKAAHVLHAAVLCGAR